MSGQDLLQTAERYKGHNDMVRASQAGLTAAQAGLKTGKPCEDCRQDCYPWEKVCRPCGKARFRRMCRAEDEAESIDGGALLGLTTNGGSK